MNVGHAEGDFGVQRILLFGFGGDELGKARDEDLAFVVDESVEERDEVGHGLGDGAAEDAGVEVRAGAGDGDGVVGAAAESIGEAGLLGSEPAK